MIKAGFSYKKNFNFFTLLLVLFVLPPALSLAAEKVSRKERSDLPIIIKSNELTADNKGKKAIFTGKVTAKQGDITILSDKLTIHYSDKKEDVEQVEAEGNVRIVQQNRTGFASKALYDSKEGRIFLSGGNPKVTQGANTITGETITYYIDEDRSIVTGSPKERVEMTIHPQTRKGNVSRP